MPHLHPAQPTFRKSTHSDGGNGCVEVAARNGRHLVRDSKNPEGDVLILDAPAWRALLGQVKAGACDP